VKYWLKLVGTNEDPVLNDWCSSQPSLLTRVDFPKHRPPNDWFKPNSAIAYAVGEGRIYAVHEVAAPPFVKPAGAIGPNERWPHHVEVTTPTYVCPLRDAPLLADIAPDVWSSHGGRKLWQQSHIPLTRDEFSGLAAAVAAATGQPPSN
jgi:hypothetical protein